jgi:hypothetical protein
MLDEEDGLSFSDPFATLRRVLAREETRAERRATELAELRNALHQLELLPRQPTVTRGGPVWEPVTADLAPAMIRHLMEDLHGMVRSSVLTLDVGPGLDEASIRQSQQRLAAGQFQQRALYPMALREDRAARAWMTSWAAVGEQQRLSLQPPSDFAIFGDRGVMAVAEWGSAASDYVLVRDPMLVSAFTALFDRAYERALPVPQQATGVDEDLRLVRLMALGLKDESIARYLGCSLRTVRRRIARLMESYGAETRFQLGAAMASENLIEAPRQRA